MEMDSAMCLRPTDVIDVSAGESTLALKRWYCCSLGGEARVMFPKV